MTTGEETCKRLINQYADKLDNAVSEEAWERDLYLLTMAAYIAGVLDGQKPPAGQNTLFQIDDGGATYWVAARTAERAIEFVKAQPDRDDEEDPHLDYPLDEKRARHLTFRFEDGQRVPLWCAFELCREHEQIICCSEWP